MSQYLLDTNICVFILRGNKDIRSKFIGAGAGNCAISEMTVVELYYGAKCSQNVKKSTVAVDKLVSTFKVIPINACIREFCRQKARLRAAGQLLDDIDLFIGTTAVALGYTMVADNVKHLGRIEGIRIENWVER